MLLAGKSTLSKIAPRLGLAQQQARDEAMEHYLWFPELYCRGCEGGAGPLCIDCCNSGDEG